MAKIDKELEFSRRQHYDAKESFKRLAFVLKSETKELFTTNQRILGNLFLPKY